ncbi:hypothetical protein [Corynebacterium genitalium]|uniref:hypothetical protein n=1 Tax=Corynebacterium genitalium TaxID=38288 RepID=UPI0001B3D5CF
MITVYGEALVDLVPAGTLPLAPLRPALGGGPFNVARARPHGIHRLVPIAVI